MTISPSILAKPSTHDRGSLSSWNGRQGGTGGGRGRRGVVPWLCVLFIFLLLVLWFEFFFLAKLAIRVS